MKRRIIDRYERSEAGEVILDVGVGSVTDLYDHFDHAASYLTKDLDEDFVAYVLACVKEIRRAPLVIRISIQTQESEERMDRVRKSMDNYFRYIRALERSKLHRLFRRCFLLAGFGVGLLVVSLRVRDVLGGSVTAEVLAEGVTVAAWVSLWNAFAGLIFDWGPIRHEMAACRRVLRADVVFRTPAEEA